MIRSNIGQFALQAMREIGGLTGHGKIKFSMNHAASIMANCRFWALSANGQGGYRARTNGLHLPVSHHLSQRKRLARDSHSSTHEPSISDRLDPGAECRRRCTRRPRPGRRGKLPRVVSVGMFVPLRVGGRSGCLVIEGACSERRTLQCPRARPLRQRIGLAVGARAVELNGLWRAVGRYRGCL